MLHFQWDKAYLKVKNYAAMRFKNVLSWRKKWLKDRTQRIKVLGGRSPAESHWAVLHAAIIIYYVQCIPTGMH